jgi:cell wall-associated NlpC family hydrolase|tara:strand:- start:191 stop:931 length:741 start_codon:yes stop_codon:yes gene_type:complete
VKNNFFFKSQFSNIYKKPTRFSEVTSQILYGEKFKILSNNKNWIKIKTSFDNYIGYIKDRNYTNSHNPTHKVASLKASIFNKSKIKTKKFLPFASKISSLKENKKFIKFEKNKWIKKKDIKIINYIDNNFLKILKLFLNTKYIWGGKSYKGIDCSAILQLFFYYNNEFYPRDTKKQISYSKKNKGIKKFRKGNIIFWNGHVAICINSTQLIHAYGPKKKVLIMPIDDTIKIIKKTANLVVKKISNI